MMKLKTKVKGTPGYLHYRVLCDYIRAAVASGQVSFEQLKLSGQLELCQLELECTNHAVAVGHIAPTAVDVCNKHALEVQIRNLQEHVLKSTEGGNVVKLFPSTKAA